MLTFLFLVFQNQLLFSPKKKVATKKSTRSNKTKVGIGSTYLQHNQPDLLVRGKNKNSISSGKLLSQLYDAEII